MSDSIPEGKEPPVSNIEHIDFQPRRRTPWGTLDGRVISLVSRKGGVGKTTSAVNLGAALALSGHTVLIVGIDPQCGVCRTLGIPPHELTTCLSDIFTAGLPMTDMVHPSALQDLFFISPRILNLEEEESYLLAMDQDADTFIHQIDRARHLYDTILIDCPSGMGPLTKAALLASDSYLVPLQTEELCRNSVDDLLEFIETFRDRNFPADSLAAGLNRPLGLEGIFLTMASMHTNMGQHVAKKAGEDFGDVLFEALVPRTTRLSEMALRGKPAVIYDRRSPGSRAYFDLADEIVERYLRTEEAMGLVDGETVPDRPHPLDADAETETEGPDNDIALKAAPEDGLDRFLSDLGGPEISASSIPSFDEPLSPEMVSLDDLLAEEEDQGRSEQKDDDWENGFWNLDGDGRDRLN